METSLDQTSKQGGSQTGTVGSGLAQDIKQQAGDITEQAKAKARQAAQSGQTAAADQLEHLAQGVRRSADNFDDEQAWVKQGLSTAAESLERFSSSLREREITDLMSEAENVARRHPVAFAAACAVAGFALVRFLKSSSRDASHGTAQEDSYGGRTRYSSTGGTDYAGDGRASDYRANI